MKYFFIVQGEGLGHTTQSLGLRSMLEKNGHTVSA
jgi:UDP:flavonoid glycosyltransferase YjiC (YdhE family)